jgi:hypothetical protein
MDLMGGELAGSWQDWLMVGGYLSMLLFVVWAVVIRQ